MYCGSIKETLQKRRECRFVIISDLIALFFVTFQSIANFHLERKIFELLRLMNQVNTFSFVVQCASNCLPFITLDFDLKEHQQNLHQTEKGFFILTLLKWISLFITILLHVCYLMKNYKSQSTMCCKTNLRSQGKYDCAELLTSMVFGTISILLAFLLYFFFANSVLSKDCENGFIPFETLKMNYTDCNCTIPLNNVWTDFKPSKSQWCIQVSENPQGFIIYQHYKDVLQITFKNTILSVFLSVVNAIKSILF